MTKTIAIFGASGSIGKGCVKYFTDNGDVVKPYGRSTSSIPDTELVVEAIDYSDPEALQAVFSKVDVVIICIGIEYSLAKWQEFWPQMARKFATAIKDTGTRTIFFDNVYAYGLVEGIMTEETPYKPASQKGKVREQVDEIFDDLIADNLPVAIAKAPDFYGPDVANGLMGPRFHDQLSKGKFEWFGNPELEHTMGYVPDFIPALHSLAHSDATGIYHLPISEESISAAKIKQILEEYTGNSYKYSLLNTGLMTVLGIFMKPLQELKEMMYQYNYPYTFESKKIQQDFPTLKTTSLKDGVQAQYDYYTS